MTDTAIFLGAGASKAEGAPLQGELFKEFFSSTEFRQSSHAMDRELATFFWLMFGINVDEDVSAVQFPTFEEVLGLTDLAAIRKEAFRDFDIENITANSGSLRFIAQYLVLLVARILHAKLEDRAVFHRRLVSSLQAANELQNVVFVSTNYDILIDNALTDQYKNDFDLDYGIDFRNFSRSDDWVRPRLNRRVQLFKPHGSLNWLYCRACGVMELTPKEKGVIWLISQLEKSTCDRCGTMYSPLIVPPTFYKDMNNVFLTSIWNQTDITLQSVQHIIFCGYSFPDADIHIKYLLKRAQTNRREPLRFTVINNHDRKKQDDRDQEQYRYKRFLGRGVDYTGLSFEDFADIPTRVLRP
jgi:hypothetical protein